MFSRIATHEHIVITRIAIPKKHAPTTLKSSLSEPAVVLSLIVSCSSLPVAEKPKSFIVLVARILKIVSGMVEM
jgi:hypothetical protein